MREKSAARIEEYRPEDDIPGERGGGGGYGRRDQDNAAFASFNRSGSGGNRACYNCGEEGHQVIMQKPCKKSNVMRAVERVPPLYLSFF